MKVVVAVSIITSVIMILFLSSLSASNIIPVQGQSLPSCPVGYQRNILGTCEPVSNLQTCPVGYQRSASGFCVPAVGSQTCPVGYQISASGCIPVTGSSFLNPYGYPTTTANPSAPHTTFNQPPSSTSTSSLVSPTLTNPPAGQMSPWFPSLPAVACGGTSTMTTIGSIERDSNSDNNNNNGKNDDDDDNKDYAFQIESDGGPSADPESVDGTVFAGEKNIERNNGRDFDIKDVFNDCQVGMFSK